MLCEYVMFLCGDVIGVVMKYLEPKQVVNFFREYELDFGMKFVYDGRWWKVGGREIDVLFGSIPNVTIVGLLVNDLCFGGKVSLDSLMYCGLDCDGNDFREIFIDTITLELINCNVMLDVQGCKKLKKLVFKKEYGFSSPHLAYLPKCLGLESLRVVDVYVNRDEFRGIEMCQKLTHFDFFGTFEEGNVLRCANLRVVRIRNDEIKDLNVLRGCEGLEELVVDRCCNLKDLGALKECVRLEKLVVRKCDELVDIGVLGECRGLRKVRIVKCNGLVSVGSVGGGKKGWVIRECPNLRWGKS